VPRKGGPGVTQSDLLVINKTDLAEAVGADLEVAPCKCLHEAPLQITHGLCHLPFTLQVMRRDASRMRGGGPTIFAQAKHGISVDDIVTVVLSAWHTATGQPLKP